MNGAPFRPGQCKGPFVSESGGGSGGNSVLQSIQTTGLNASNPATRSRTVSWSFLESEYPAKSYFGIHVSGFGYGSPLVPIGGFATTLVLSNGSASQVWSVPYIQGNGAWTLDIEFEKLSAAGGTEGSIQILMGESGSSPFVSASKLIEAGTLIPGNLNIALTLSVPVSTEGYGTTISGGYIMAIPDSGNPWT